MSSFAVSSSRWTTPGRRRAIVGATFFLLLGVWQVYATMIYDDAIPLPTPISTIEAFVELMESGDLQAAALESLTVFLVGTVPGIVIGIGAGLVIGSSRPLDTSFTPYLFAFYATPFPALIPIFILLFGLGVIGKGAIVFTLVVTTVLLQTIAGVRSVDGRFIEAARSLGTSRPRLLLEVQLPSALAFIIAGVRLAVGRALVGVVVAEFDTALSGLGALIFGYAGRLQLSKALVPALLFAIAGIVLSLALRSVERRFERWRQVGA